MTSSAVDLSDVELMTRFRDGDESAFEVLFSRHARAVGSFLSRMVRDEGLAQDLLQVTFMSLVRSRLRYVPGTPVGPWLFTIAGNAARDALRRGRHAAAYATSEAPTEPASTEGPSSDPGLRKQLTAALAALTPEQREAVVLHKVEGWSFDQIAKQAGITETAARIRAHRGYERLRQLLGEHVETS